MHGCRRTPEPFFIDGAMALARLREIIEIELSVGAGRSTMTKRPKTARASGTPRPKNSSRASVSVSRSPAPSTSCRSPSATISSSLYADLLDSEAGQTVERGVPAGRIPSIAIRCDGGCKTWPTHPYAEIQDNLIAADMLPIDILRCKLSFLRRHQIRSALGSLGAYLHVPGRAVSRMNGTRSVEP